MRKKIFLLLGLIGLYLLASLGLYLVYGPSCPFLAGEDCWIPDGTGGWLAHGHPDDPSPTVSSTNVPIILQYMPIFMPALLLILFTFTPLRRKLDGPIATSPPEDSTNAGGIG